MSQRDLITLMAGDPMGRVEERGKDASAYFSQYLGAKKRIEEINKAIEAAQAAANRSRGKYGLGGSLLGGLLGIGSNILFPMLGGLPQALVQGVLSGAGSYLAEDKRQKKHDATGKLKELKEKYKGRKEAKALDATINTIEQGLKDAKKTGAMTSAMMGAAMPTNIGKGARFGKTGVAGPFTKVPKVVGHTQIPISAAGQQGVTAFQNIPITQSIPSGVAAISGPAETYQQSLLNQLIPIPGAAEAISDLASKPGGQSILAALRLGYSPAMQKMAPELVIDPYYAPEFRNPYRRGY
tara:strand:- start:1125 stop:2012 length:888 start_codon:yes stop_codon:yes gene_type:complete